MEFSWLPAAVLMVIFFTLLAFGLWIGISLILVGFIALHFFTSMPAGKILGLSIWNTLNNWPLTCLPLFIFMGDILSRSKLSEQLFSGLAPWVHRLPGKLLHVNVLGCALFAAISGSSAATCATIGKITLPEFKRLKYDEALSVGSIAGSGTLGFMIPPSIVMIIYGVLADVSVGKLFMAGVVPGLMMAAIFMGYVILRGVLNPAITPGATRFTRRDRLHSLPKLIPILSLIVVVLGTIYTGLATPTEAAAIGVGGALLIGWFTRTLTWQNLRESLQASTVTTCMMCLIVVGATYFSMAMSYGQRIDDRDHASVCGADRQAGRVRSGLVRHLPGYHVRIGTDYPAGRLQPFRPAERGPEADRLHHPGDGPLYAASASLGLDHHLLPGNSPLASRADDVQVERVGVYPFDCCFR
ncbi:MAG: hypothetical protein H6Q42_1881 [Deltaproteobacteria bacterium]|nr:hypothetical protein [Deltaproteobacteria bacterium]